MSNNKLKRPALNFGKHIVPQPVKVDPDTQPPKFSLRYMAEPYCVSSCDKDHKVAFAERLRKLSRMSWSEIRQAPRHGLGSELIARDDLNVPIPPHISPDVNFLALRFNGKKPMVGYREADGTFQILWLDHNFTVYDHN